MIDDELLQELLSKASSLYNNGDYKGAIGAWNQVLGMDPSSRKAKEGIRMATLLMGDWEPPAATADSGSSAGSPADGAASDAEARSPGEITQQLDAGIAAVKRMLSERRYAEAVERARQLVPIDPDSDEVQKLLEEAQQAFEAAPFIEEQLILAKELFGQQRYPEAEAQCRKIFTLDPSHPDGLALAELIQARMNEVAQTTADLSGATVKMDLSEVTKALGESAVPEVQSSAAEASASDPGLPEGSPEPPQAVAPAPELPEVWSEPEPSAAPDPGPSEGPPEPALPDPLPELEMAVGPELGSPELSTDGEAPAATDPGSIEGLPEVENAAAPEPPPQEVPELEMVELPDLPLDGEMSSGAEAASPESGEEPEIVEARTVVKPSVRLVPRSGTVPGAELPSSSESAQAAAPAAPSPQEPSQVAPEGSSSEPDATAWETELTKLNLKAGERSILGPDAGKISATPEEPAAGQDDLMSALDADLGAAPLPGDLEAEGSLSDVESIPLAGGAEQPVIADAASAVGALKDLDGALGLSESPSPQSKERSTARSAAGKAAIPDGGEEVPEQLADPQERTKVPVYFALLGVAILVVLATGWWFFFHPRTAGGAGSPTQPTAPPPDVSPGSAAGVEPGPIPTPIGGPRRLPADPPKTIPGPAGGGSDGAATAAAVAAGVLLPVATPSTPSTPSPEAARQAIQAHVVEGRRLMAQERWREAMRALNDALALDPDDLEALELASQVRTKLEAETKTRNEVEGIRTLFNEKDYRNALWKLYRLPRDQNLGDIDLFIRNAWYNWGIVSTRAGDVPHAMEYLGEALSVDPGDPLALEAKEAIEPYVTKPKDRIYFAAVKRLQLRAIDQR